MSNLKNISVLVEDTGASQSSFFIISELNKLSASNPEIDAIIFYENQHKNCLPANFAVMPINEGWGQSGPIIATSFSTAHKLLSFPSNKKIFYVWDLEWIRNGYNSIKKYESYSSVYTDQSLELVARSESHKRAIENAFNRKVNHVISDFNMSDILEILK